MASNSNFRRWIVVGLVALGVVLAATLPRRGSEEAEQDSEPAEASEASRRQAPLDGGKASRRIADGCEPIDESLKYEEFVGKRALAVLSWNGMSEPAAGLKIPVYVVGIEDGTIGVRFLQFPMREQYLGIWLGSGHIRSGPKDVFLLEPCSATIVAWPAMERGD
ncbi:MAG: hypothetical protein O7F08_10000 [Deltaproteobacteria bacterium]|nr:hypothetical protein [Deltaproteobacteria bacterium]